MERPAKRRTLPSALPAEAAPLELVTTADVSAALRARFGSPGYKPPLLPVVAMEVLALSGKRDVEVDALAALLEKDPILAGRILQLVQSPVFAGRSPIRSLRQAVVRLGLATMRDVVLEAAMNMRIFRAEGFAPALEQLRKHSTQVAHLARAVCRYASIESELAFMCGLLHDVGIAASLVCLAEDPALRAVGVEQLLSSVDEVHTEASGQLARLWKLPEETAFVLEHHHSLQIGGHVHPLTAVLAVAEELCVRAGAPVSLHGPSGTLFLLDRDRPQRLEEASAALRLNAKQLALLEKDASVLAHQGID